MATGVSSYDVVVAGAGPGGSVAAFELARGGARVALVDKASFPRDKACGDLVGPRGVGLLRGLEIVPAGTVSLGDMAVIGPSGGRVVLPAVPGLTYPGCAWALPRKVFDDVLYQSAMKAGAEAITARVSAVEVNRDGDAVVRLDDGARLGARFVIGADGATSAVAGSVGMVRADRVQWGFAVRTYIEAEVELPVIVLFDEEPGVGFPGYGWIFPGPDGMANAGVGVGTGSDRRAGARATRYLDTFLGHLRGLGLLPEGAVAGPRLGGWLKMGMLGTSPVSGPVMLVGDAAGLVNPLQGEGIAQAMLSGMAAASAVLGAGVGVGGADAGRVYGQWLRGHQSAYQGSTACLQGLMLTSPRMVSRVGRVLTWPPVGRRLAPGWALYWNDLVTGAAPSRGRWLGRVASGLIRGVSAGSPSRRELDRDLVGDR
ncbi:MAG TPA: geranylgeranyl reductase family protein [Acidimicrobiales bacterium]|nr:geranylgeranyl reductase family protein [Acidimicrobiales bacterium]